jgi:DNA modification methylase
MHRTPHKKSRRPGQTPPKPPRQQLIVSRAIAELTLNERNPRVHSPRQIRQLANSIDTFGFNGAVLIDREGKVIAGHARILACQQLGWTEVPTICLDHLSPDQARAFMIADNRLSEISTWNEQLLAETLRDLSLVDLDFSLEATGFEMAEIDLRIESLNASAKGEDDPADAPAALPTGPAVSRLGELWLLGRHRLLCGNALDEAAYARLMPGKQAAMMFTDPPYNVPIAGHVSGLGAVTHREFAMASGEMSPPEFTTFLHIVLDLAARHSRDGSLHLVCMDWRHMGELLTAGAKVYTELKNLCVWAKDNAGMGSLYRSQHELVFVYKSGRAPHRNNIQLGRHGRHRSNLWSYPGVNSFGRRGEEGNLLALHPTVKPVALVADAILDCSARGDLVLDPFLGSGTTLMAAERVGRRCCGMELDPLYVDTIIRRWQALTGDTARHAETGETFEDVAAARKTDAVQVGEAVHAA